MDTSRDFAILASLVSRRLRAKFKEYLPNDTITAVEWLALLWIDQGGGLITQGQLAEKLELSDAPASRLVQALVSQGLVTQEASRLDRRAKTLRLTAASQSYVEMGRDIGARIRKRAFAGISEAELTAALKVLRTVAERLD